MLAAADDSTDVAPTPWAAVDVTDSASTRAPYVDVTHLDLGDDIVFITDPDGIIVAVNDAFVRVTGYSRQEAIGQTPRLISSGYQDDAFYQRLWATISGGKVWQGELVDRRQDGLLRTHHVTITPITDGSGRITHYLAVERDVSGELGRQVAIGATGLVHTDTAGRCVYASDRAAVLLGRMAADVLGAGLAKSLVREDADAFREAVLQSIDTGRVHRVEVRTRADGWLGIVVAPLTLGAGEVIGATCALEDVARELEARTELARHDALMASVLDALPEPVAVVDGSGIVVAVNAAWRRCPHDTAIGDLASAEVGDDALSRTRRAAIAGDANAGVLDEALRRVLRRGGSHRRLQGVSITPLSWDEGGAVVRLWA